MDRDSINLVEATMCLWEAFLEAEIAHRRQDSFDLPEQSPPDHSYPALCMLREDYGTWAVRHKIIEAAPECEAAWLALSDDERDGQAFDWEFCPKWLAAYDEAYQL